MQAFLTPVTFPVRRSSKSTREDRVFSCTDRQIQSIGKTPLIPHGVRVKELFKLENPQFTDATDLTTPLWRFVLLSDAHSSQVLAHIARARRSAPKHVHTSSTTSHIHRTEVLHPATLSHPILYTTSIWTPSAHRLFVEGQSEPLYETFNRMRVELSRSIPAIYYGVSCKLCSVFGVKKGTHMWARDFVLRRNGEVFVSMHEVFSPRLESYLGPIVSPREFHTCNIISTSANISVSSSETSQDIRPIMSSAATIPSGEVGETDGQTASGKTFHSDVQLPRFHSGRTSTAQSGPVNSNIPSNGATVDRSAKNGVSKNGSVKSSRNS